MRFHISNGVGFWKWTSRSFRQMAIGYFQSYVWSSDSEVHRKISLIRVLNPSMNLLKLEKHFQSNYIITVHVRLSDYVNEPSIGVLDRKYYEKALENISDLRGKEIWLFSDDPKSARELMPSTIRDNCTSIADFGLTSSEEWQLMRYADEFFISNSTFSWWAARLAIKPKVKVYAPSPWFAKGPQPQELLPPSWQEVERS
jgi:hypothetical protein